MSVLAFTATWQRADGSLAMRPETRASVAAQRGLAVWEIGIDNPFGPGDLRNVGHQVRNGWQMALDGGHDLLTVEHDIQLPDAGAVERLAATAGEIVYGVYMLRHGTPMVNTYELYPGRPRNIGESLSAQPRLLARARSRNVWPVSGVGWGCTLIRHSLLRRMRPVDVNGDNPAVDTVFATQCLRAGVRMVARFDVMCGHWDGQRWLWPFGKDCEMVRVIGVQKCVLRGGFRLAPGVEIELPEDVADDAVRVGFASYVTRSSTCSGGGTDMEVSDAGDDVDEVVAVEGTKAGRRPGGRGAGRGGD